jgi:hypothetical protein
MENSNEIRLKKIPLLVLLEALKDVYERGADYVDIIGVPGVEQDSIGIAINREYFAPEDEEDDDDSITDEDLNQLI